MGLTDLRTTPLETGFPGVEVHANLLDTLLQSNAQTNYSYYRPDWEPGLTFTVLLLAGLAFVLVLPRLEPGYMLVVSVGWLAVLTLANLAFWKSAHYDLPLSILILCTLVIAIFNISYGFLRSNLQKREMKTLFGQYVPPAHVDQILSGSQTINMEGEFRFQLGQNVIHRLRVAISYHRLRRTGIDTGPAQRAAVEVPVAGRGHRSFRANIHTGLAPFHTEVRLERQLRFRADRLRVLAPDAAQRAALEEHRAADAGAVVQAEMLHGDMDAEQFELRL